MEEELIFRADANTHIGTGHLMRCLALAQSWRDRSKAVTFITCCESKSLRKRLSEEGIQVVMLKKPHPNQMDWEITSQILRKSSDSWVVLDGYHFDPNYQNQVKKYGHQLLVIDDTAHLDRYYADILLNQNIYAENLKYSYEKPARTLLGTQYVLLRSEFLVWRDWKREIPEVARKILVTMGGSDPINLSLKIIEAIKATNIFDLEVKIVVGASNPYIDNLKKTISSAPFTMSIHHDVANMAELMSWADIAIAAGGTTCWEMAFMRLPFFSFVLADNQRIISDAVDRAGIAVSCGWHYELNAILLAERLVQLIHDRSARKMMSIKGGELVDGFGRDRTIKAMVD
jgi:UDP-2,4-diacetamido-2,4,6-trideoxy-beta-L-altropyranose hydrolase